MHPPERKILPTRKKNLHHPLAESLGGWRSVTLNAQEHEAYHYAFGHQPPCMALRRLLYATMKRNGYSIMVDSAEKLCDTLTPQNWKDLYRVDAFAPGQPRGERGRLDAALAAYHMRRYLDAERSEITYAIGRLSGLDEPNGMKHAMIFFRANNPLTAMNRMVKELTGKRGKTRYKWVDPLKENVRRQVEDLTETPEVERLTKARREMMIALLNIQDGRIAEYQSNIVPSLRENIDILAKLGDGGKVDMNRFD